MENTNKFSIGGIFTFEQVRNGKVIDTWSQENIVVDTGLNYLLDAALSGGTVNVNHYIGLFSNNYTPIAGTIISDLVEVNAKYDEVTRPIWSELGAVTKTITNSASPATFTFNAGETVYGAFLTSNQTKGSNTGTLVAASKFLASRVMIASDVLRVTYTLTISST